MKSMFLAVMLSLSCLWAKSQAGGDNLFIINNQSDNPPYGISVLSDVDPNTAAVNGTLYQYDINNATTRSAAMAISPDGQWLYYIPQESNGGGFNLYSIPAYTTGAPPATTGTPLLTGEDLDLNGAANTNEIYFRRLGASKNGVVYMMVTEPATGVIYLASFQIEPNGGASNFRKLGKVTLDGAQTSPDFNNGDLVLDGKGNMYILVNEDGNTGGSAIIYFLPASVLQNASDENSVTNITSKYTLKNPATNNDFQGLVVGLALSSTGTFYVAVQGLADGGIYSISNGLSNGTIPINGPTFSNELISDFIADLATNYFPDNTTLPVEYGAISAKISGESLILNWTTLTETNNARFDIEVSANGVDFTKIGTVSTKAVNGNSDKAIQYEFTKSVNGTMAVMGISLLSLGFILLLWNRKNRVIMAVMIFAGIGLTATSCSKNAEQVDVRNEGKVFVRLVQFDIDGKSSTSEVIRAFKAD